MAKHPDDRDLFPGALEIMVLKSLRLKPMHGYALVKHIKHVSDNLLQVEEGLALSGPPADAPRWSAPVRGGISAKGRPTRIYSVTEAGLRHLEKEVLSFEKMFAGITRVLAFNKV